MDTPSFDSIFFDRLIGHPMPGEYVWSLIPRRCHASKKLVWLRKAYRVRYAWSGGPGGVTWTIWFTEEDYILNVLRGTLPGQTNT